MAAGNIDIRMIGDKALQRKLRKFPLALQKKVIRKETRASVYRLQKHALTNLRGGKVNTDSGAFYNAIAAMQAWALSRSRVRVGHGIPFPTRDVLGIDAEDKWYYPSALEYGTKARKGRGVGPEFRIMRDAIDDHKTDEIRQIARGIHAGAVKLWKRAG